MTNEIEMKSTDVTLDTTVQPQTTCPTCGSETQPEQHYTGGTYRFFACCTRNPEHQATRL